MNSPLKQATPLVNYAIAFLGLFALIQTLVILKEALIPLCLAIIFSIIMQPMVANLNKRGLNRVISIVIPLVGILGLVIFLILWVSSQFTLLLDTIPIFMQKWDALVKEFTLWISNRFELSRLQTSAWMKQASSTFFSSGQPFLKPFLLSFGELLVWLLFIPVYTFMMLYYRSLFISVLFSKHASKGLLKIQEIYASTNEIIKSYLQGLVLESAIVAGLNAIGLLIIGVDYAILLGILGGALNVIPYVGGMVAVALPMLVVLATKPFIYALYVLLLYVLIQLLDNNLIMPQIVSFKVQVNGLVSIFVVVLGGMMWGVTGMFLSIPFSAILKVSLDHFKGYEAWGKLLGNENAAK